jgi:hypothetical protein
MSFSLNVGMNFNLHHHLLIIGDLEYFDALVYFMGEFPS